MGTGAASRHDSGESGTCTGRELLQDKSCDLSVGGEGEIRTPEELKAPGTFRECSFQPLTHLSVLKFDVVVFYLFLVPVRNCIPALSSCALVAFPLS